MPTRIARCPLDSELVRAIAVLARAQQDATWRRTKAVQELRSLLREYYPGFLAAFTRHGTTNLASPDARAVLAIAPTPAAAATLTRARIAAALRRGGRQRNIEPARRHAAPGLRQPQLRQQPRGRAGAGHPGPGAAGHAQRRRHGVEQLSDAVREAFPSHPDYTDHHQLPRPR